MTQMMENQFLEMKTLFFLLQLCLVVDAFLSPSEMLASSTRSDNYKCIVMGLFLHYFFLAQFMWILVQVNRGVAKFIHMNMVRNYISLNRDE
jgi:hypothetical protein